MQISKGTEDLEIGRRLVHSSGVVFPILYYFVLDRTEIMGLLSIAVLIASILEFLRIKKGYNNIIFDNLTRDYESNKLAGYHLYLVGMLVASVFYQPVIAMSSMVMVAVCDPIGGILGNAEEDESKSVWVLLSVILSGWIISTPVILYSYGINTSILLGLVVGVGTGLSDFRKLSIKGYIIDDNLLIPVVSGLMCQVLIYIMEFYNLLL